MGLQHAAAYHKAHGLSLFISKNNVPTHVQIAHVPLNFSQHVRCLADIKNVLGVWEYLTIIFLIKSLDKYSNLYYVKQNQGCFS